MTSQKFSKENKQLHILVPLMIFFPAFWVNPQQFYFCTRHSKLWSWSCLWVYKVKYRSSEIQKKRKKPLLYFLKKSVLHHVPSFAQFRRLALRSMQQEQAYELGLLILIPTVSEGSTRSPGDHRSVSTRSCAGCALHNSEDNTDSLTPHTAAHPVHGNWIT